MRIGWMMVKKLSPDRFYDQARLQKWQH